MKNLFTILFIFCCIVTHSQFYYNDILGTQELKQRMKNYIESKVASITVTGLDADGMKNNSFYELHEIKENGKLLKISALNETNRTNILYRFDANGNLITQTDSSLGVKTVTEYKYDNNGRIRSILNTSMDAENEFNQAEEHVWLYNANGLPEKMWRIINGKDSLLYQFTIDDNNVADEYQVKNKVKYDPLYYYYYDVKKRLTDIARYNKIVQKILPDFMFEYDEQDRVIQKIATVAGAQVGYVIFRFGFNEKGLKTREVLFNRLKNKTGSIEYQYTFSH